MLYLTCSLHPVTVLCHLPRWCGKRTSLGQIIIRLGCNLLSRGLAIRQMDTAIDRRALIRDLEESFLLTGGGELRGAGVVRRAFPVLRCQCTEPSTRVVAGTRHFMITSGWKRWAQIAWEHTLRRPRQRRATVLQVASVEGLLASSNPRSQYGERGGCGKHVNLAFT